MELGQYKEAAASFRSARDAFAERGMETDVADICLNLGGLLTEMTQYENARASLETAYAIYTERGQVVDAVLASEGLGIVLAELGNYQEAVSRLAEARAIFAKFGRELEVASVDQNLGIIHNHFSRHEEAITALLTARKTYVSHSLWVSVADVDGNLGNVFSNMDQYKEALRRYGMAREVYVEQEMLVDVARVNLSVGGVLGNLGLYEEALNAYKDARTTYSSLDLDVQAAEASANIGIIHCLLGRMKDGVQQFEVARAIFDAHGMSIDVAKCDTGIANAYSELGQYDDALAKYETTRAAFLSCGMDVSVATINQNIGVVYLYLGRYVEALTSYQSARAVYVDYGMEVDVAKVDANIGNVYRYLGRYADALKAYEGALELLDEAPPLPGMTCSHPAARWMLLSNLGVAYEGLKQWDEARQAYEDSIVVIESIRGGFTSEDLKIAWQERTQDVYELLIDLLYRMGQGASAFTYAERCRARTFLDALYQGSITPNQLISPEAGISSGAVDPIAIDQAVLDARDSLQPNEAVLEYMVTDSGVYLWVVTNEGIRDPIFIEYQREQLMNDVITLRQAIENSNPDTITVNEFLASFYDKLVKKSLAKLSDKVDILILIPSGPLWYLPFSALIMTDQAGVPSGGLGTRSPYLVEKFTLAYLPSLASLSSLTKGETEAAGGVRLLALADPELSPDQLHGGEGSKCGEEKPLDRYEQLVAACQEFAKRLVGEEQEEQCVYAGKEAQEARAHKETGRQVVVYAAHGQFNPYVPLQSKLLLAPGGKATNLQTDFRVLDGNYHAWEALLTDYRGTELVILAACETLLPHLKDMQGALAVLAEQECDQVELTPQQLEQIVVGDEVVGLARAFLSSGAEAVLGTLWLANPTAIGKLLTSMAEYHKSEGNTWVQALTKAQRDLIKGNTFKNPWFWAPYQLIGRWR
jgi:CHAT domain-containing protein/tetratricopeptide (TPR) repeat protein